MWTRDYNQTGSRIALLVGQFLVLMFCFLYIDYVYIYNILPDKHVSDTFQQVDCMVVSKRLNTTGIIIHKYRADFLINYTVGNLQYNRWVSGNGLDMSFTSNQTDQETTLAQYELNATYPCYVDPANPSIALLVLRHNWLSTFPLVIPTVIGLIVAYYFFKNLSQLAGGARVKMKERRRLKKK